MKPLVPGHCYELDDATILTFVHRNDDGTMFTNATTTCELIEVLIHRLLALNAKNPCPENDDTVFHLEVSRGCQQMRKLRIEYMDQNKKEIPA